MLLGFYLLLTFYGSVIANQKTNISEVTTLKTHENVLANKYENVIIAEKSKENITTQIMKAIEEMVALTTCKQVRDQLEKIYLNLVEIIDVCVERPVNLISRALMSITPEVMNFINEEFKQVDQITVPPTVNSTLFIWENYTTFNSTPFTSENYPTTTTMSIDDATTFKVKEIKKLMERTGIVRKFLEMDTTFTTCQFLSHKIFQEGENLIRTFDKCLTPSEETTATSDFSNSSYSN